MNVISSDVVQKSKLSMEKHPDPYKLSWVDDTSIPIKNRCSFTFSLSLVLGHSTESMPFVIRKAFLYHKEALYDDFKNYGRRKESDAKAYKNP